jgi:hypothetical protein
MRDRPSAAELLEQARAVLLAELLEDLPAEKRYTGLMVASAMAIAMRECAAGDRPLHAELTGLSNYYDDTSTESADGAKVEQALVRLNRRLAADLRGGRADGDPTVFSLLRRVAIDKLRESNPRALPPE